MSSVPGIITNLDLYDIRESGPDTDQTDQFEMVKNFNATVVPQEAILNLDASSPAIIFLVEIILLVYMRVE